MISKEIRRAEHEYMNPPPPPPINALATALVAEIYFLYFSPNFFKQNAL